MPSRMPKKKPRNPHSPNQMNHLVFPSHSNPPQMHAVATNAMRFDPSLYSLVLFCFLSNVQKVYTASAQDANSRSREEGPVKKLERHWKKSRNVRDIIQLRSKHITIKSEPLPPNLPKMQKRKNISKQASKQASATPLSHFQSRRPLNQYCRTMAARSKTTGAR